jgi:hypothetical protein
LEGGYITLDGQRIDLTQHSTDFQVIGNAPAVSAALLPAKGEHASRAVRSGPGTYRMQVASTDCDNVMEEVRKDAVASPVALAPVSSTWNVISCPDSQSFVLPAIAGVENWISGIFVVDNGANSFFRSRVA